MAFLAVALGEWSPRRTKTPVRRPGPAGWRGNLILLGVTLLFCGGFSLVAAGRGWSIDRALWVGVGALLAFMTIVRPWWFWENYKARWLRDMIGDGPTAAFYLLVAGVMVWVGLYTQWTFGRH